MDPGEYDSAAITPLWSLTTEDGAMSDEWWGVEPAVTGRLIALGWTADDDAVRQVMPTIARHGNAVIAVPTSPAQAAPALAGVVAAIHASRGRAVVLTAPALVGPIGRQLGELTRDTSMQVVTATGPARAARRLADGSVDLLVASPATALGLLTRSALATDQFTSIVLCWPEDWNDDEAVTLLLADLSREAQRVILTADPERITALADRHVRRALVVPAVPVSEPAPPPPRSIRTMGTTWHNRAGAITTLLELLDPGEATIWSADRGAQAESQALSAELRSLEVVSGTDFGTAPLIICVDLPTRAQLALLGAGRDVVLMLPPGTTGYAQRIAPNARPLRLVGLVDHLRDHDATLRAEIEATIARGQLTAASYALAPLLDRHDPQAIAAACYALWRRTSGTAAVDGPPAEASVLDVGPASKTAVGGIAQAKLWVGVGRRDEATVGDIVAVLVKEVGLPRESIGRIELRETFALVEVPAVSADQAAVRLTGITIRRRKVIARVDRGPSGDRSGGGSAGGRSSGGNGPPRGGTGPRGGGSRPPRR